MSPQDKIHAPLTASPLDDTSEASAKSARELLALIGDLETATEGSRELDASIFIATADIPEGARIDQHGGVVGWWPLDTAYQSAREVPRYTTSLDCALSLIPEGVEWDMTNIYGIGAANVGLNAGVDCYTRRVDGNVILALVTAALKFRSAQGTEARSGETHLGLDPKGDGPVGEADAPKGTKPGSGRA